MTAAAKLLSQPAIPVRDVARQVGYHQPSHFARALRRRHGVSPSVFRAESRQEKCGEAPEQASEADYCSHGSSSVYHPKTKGVATTA